MLGLQLLSLVDTGRAVSGKGTTVVTTGTANDEL